MKEYIVPFEELMNLCERKLTLAHLDPDHAQIVADVLVHANLRGVDSHGVMTIHRS